MCVISVANIKKAELKLKRATGGRPRRVISQTLSSLRASSNFGNHVNKMSKAIGPNRDLNPGPVTYKNSAV